MSAGQMLVRQGDAPDGLYLIYSGRLGIYGRTVHSTREVRLAMCGPGDAVGEIAWLSGHERTATVRAESDSAVLRVDKGRSNDLVRIDATVRHAVSNKLLAHLRVAESAIVRNAPAER